MYEAVRVYSPGSMESEYRPSPSVAALCGCPVIRTLAPDSGVPSASVTRPVIRPACWKLCGEAVANGPPIMVKNPINAHNKRDFRVRNSSLSIIFWQFELRRNDTACVPHYY